MHKNIILLSLSCSLLFSCSLNRFLGSSGNKYYTHRVEAKQTMFSISKTYNVSIATIMSVNGKITTDLQIGELLRIPYVDPTTVLQKPKYHKHMVQKGETLYSLARKYRVSEAAIIALNKGVENSLREGRELKIPTIGEPQSRYDSKYYYHQVKTGETLYAISRHYGVKYKKLKRKNDTFIDINNLQIGDEVRIPVEYAREEIEALKIANKMHDEATEAWIKKQDSIVSMEELMRGRYIPNYKKKYEMVIMLPFTNSWSGIINYYKGMRLAMEQEEKTDTTKFNIYVYDTKGDRLTAENILQKHLHSDFIIGPYSQDVFPATLSIQDTINTTLVSLLSKNDVVYNHNNVLQLNTTERTINKKIAEYVINNHKFDNIICFDGVSYTKYLPELLKVSSEQILNLSNLLDSGKDKIEYDYKKNYTEEFRNIIDKNKNNIIIVTETDRRIVGHILGTLDTFNTADIQVIGNYKWKFFSTIEPDLFYRLNVTYFTPFNYMSYERPEFVAAYKEKFQCYPDDLSFIGYETVRKLLEGIQKGGANFYKNPDIGNIIKYENGGYENSKLYKVTFTKDYKIMVGE